jgi:hypothetical protein
MGSGESAVANAAKTKQFSNEMSSRATRSQEDLTGINQADLFNTPPNTKRRVNPKKSIRKTPSESKSNIEGGLLLNPFTTDQNI